MLAAGLLLMMSSLAHSFLGWPQIRPELVAAGVPDDLVGALAAGWHFGGVAMVAFAAIVLMAWRRARRGDVAGLEAVGVVAAAYIVFGTTAFVLRSFAPFFLVFIAPGVALAVCAWGRVREHPG
jgi:Na+/proline symporter